VPRFAQVVGVAMGAATFIYLAVMTLGFETFGLNAQARMLLTRQAPASFGLPCFCVHDGSALDPPR